MVYNIMRFGNKHICICPANAAARLTYTLLLVLEKFELLNFLSEAACFFLNHTLKLFAIGS